MDLSRAIAPRVRVSLRFLLLLGCAGTGAIAHQAIAAGTLPSGGHFVAGIGGISGSGATTTIMQSSKRGIINWNSFSIGKGGTVQFDNGSGATLNKVTGGNMSTIAGELKATGSVYLINQNGVVVGAGGMVVTGGTFVASTRDTSDSQFMAGGSQTFSGTSNGAVVNDGVVVSQTGSVVLVGHAVTNSNTVDAANGTAVLASGNRVLMTDASGPDRVYVAGASGDTTNDGQVKAAAVELAAAGGNVYALAGNRTGLIRATGTKTVDGQVWLTAPDGAVDVAGKVTATDANGAGGTIYTNGASLTVADSTVLNAAGTTGHGRITTSGGAVSIGKATVTAGKKGRWVIDPTNLTIDSSAAATIDTTLNGGTGVLEQTTGTTALGLGNQSGGNGDITVAAPISWNTTAQLTLSSFHNIDIDAAITATGNGAVVLTTNNGLNGTSSGGTLNFLMGQGSLQIGPTGGALTINGANYTLVHTIAQLQGVGSSGNYALAANLNVGAVAGESVIPTFSGTFNGLGNTVNNLTIASTTGGQVGLFGTIGSGGTVANLGIVGASVTGSANGVLAGVLAGTNNGTVTNSYATGSLSAGPDNAAGGLIGLNTGEVSLSYTNVVVSGLAASGALGGIVGTNNGSIVNVYANGSVTGGAGSAAGGLVGSQNAGGTVSDAYATGLITGGGFGVGGIVGDNGGTVTNSYWDINSTGIGAGGGGGGGGLSTAQLAGRLPTGFLSSIWANAGNTVTPYLGSNPGLVIAGSDSSATPTLYNLVFTPTQLQAIGNNATTLAGNYALAQNIDMTGVAGFSPIGESTAFSGTFNGLGNVVANLTISSSGSVGLFGVIGAAGTVENLGLLGGSTAQFGGGAAGALAGQNGGTISNVYATGTVTGPSENGGLVGVNTGIIGDAYATGAVSRGNDTGGLVAINSGTISNAYATGAVSGSDQYEGGLVGQINGGSISTSYATGQVINGSSSAQGGLVGDRSAGTISHSFWNVDRSGQSNGIGTDADPAGGLPTGLSGSAPFTLSDYTGFMASTTPDATGNAWVIVDTDGTLNNAGGGAGATMPMLAFEYSTNIVNVHQLQLMAMDTNANYTLARNIDASATNVASPTAGTDVWGITGFAPVGPYTGAFTGAGRSISGLTINNTAATNVGLFSTLGAGGVVQNVTLSGGTITGGNSVGAVVGLNSAGTVTNVSSNATVGGTNDVGGLVGINDAAISSSHATGAVTGGTSVGGLAGLNQTGGTITGSDAGGAVNGSDNLAGGLVGLDNGGAITGSHATGDVTESASSSFIGGLVGQLEGNGTIGSSNATGTVTGTGVSDIDGGLVGQNEAGSTLSNSYATGAVTVTNSSSASGGLVGVNYGTLNDVYATGAVAGGSADGGLIAVNYGTGVVNGAFAAGAVRVSAGNYGAGLAGYNAGSISNAYAVGAVVASGNTAYVGGLVGLNATGGTLSSVYATGAVQAVGISSVGGLVATNNGAVNFGYWDTGTTGRATSAAGTAMTTAQLQAGLPTGFSSATWGSVADKSYPYLLFEFGAGVTPQVVAGTVYTDGGATDAGAGITVNALANGATVNSAQIGGTVTTGADGYYYYLVAPGTIAANANVLTYAQNYGSGGTISGVAATDQSDGYPTHLDILGNTLHVETQAGSWSAASANVVIADGGALPVAGLTNLRVDAFDASGFTIDTAMTAIGSVTVNAAGNLSITGGSVTAGGSATLATAGDFSNTAGAGAISSGSRWLVYSTNPNDDADGGLADSFIQYGATDPTNSAITSLLTYGGATAALGAGNGFLYSASALVTLTGVTKTYDGTTGLTTSPTTFTASGGIAGDTITLGGSPVGSFASANSNAGTGIPIDVSVSGLTVSATRGGVTVFGYTIGAVSNDAIGTINQKTLTATLTGTIDKTYDGTNVATLGSGNFSLSGFVSAQGGTVTQTVGTYASANAGGGIAVSASLSPGEFVANTGTLLSNYILPVAAAGTGTIGKAALTVTAAGDTLTYSGTAFSGGNGVTYSGFVNAETSAALGGALSFAGSSQGAINVGSYAITPQGLTSGNYAISFVGSTLTITPKALTVSLIGTVDKTYDGTAAAALTSGNYMLSGVVAGDAVALNDPTTGSYDTPDAGNGKLVTVTGLGLTGAADGNYTVVSSVSGAVGEIDRKALTATLTGTIDKTYDGTNVATLGSGNFSLSGFVGAQGATVTQTVGTYASANAGSGVAVTTGLNPGEFDANTGTLLSNYILPVVATGTGTIGKAALTVTLVGTVDKTYDGTTVATLASGNYMLNGVIGGDAVALNDPTTGSYDTADAGNGKLVTVTGLGLTGAAGGNYTVAGSVSGAVGEIDPKALTVSLTGRVEKTYNGTTAATLTSGNYVLGGVVGGDAVTLNDPTAGTYGTANAGTGELVTVTGLILSGADAGNYSVATSAAGAVGQINRAALTVTLGNVTRVYDGAGFSGGGGAAFSGFMDGETSAVLGGTLAYGGASQGAVNAGNYAIDGHGLTARNYTIVYDAGTLTIDPKVITAELTGTVTKKYDGNTTATLASGNYLLSGVIAGDRVTLNDPTTGTYASAVAGTGIVVTADGLALSGAQAGNYRLASMTVTGDVGTISGAPVVPPFIPVIPPQPSAAPADAEAAHSLVVPQVDLSEMAKLSGCSGEDFVAVVPEEDGHVGAVVVESEGNKTLLHAAYAGCANSKPVMTNAQEVQNLFGGALAARPTPPAYYDLYYGNGSVTLVPNALAAFDKVFADIMKRKAAEVVVAGYTDTVGDAKVNDRLSLERAQAVSKLLVARGLAPASITAVGRGERDPQVPTKEQVAEEKNRRVEITVR
jgi:filamentous hemagglutinin family protein